MTANSFTTSFLTKPLHPPLPKFNLIATLEKQLEGIPEDAIMGLSRKIYPVENMASNVYNCLFRTLLNYFMIQGNKGQQYSAICGDVIRFASQISNLLVDRMTEILTKEDVKNRLMESCKKNSYSLPGSQSLVNGGSKKTTSLLDNLCNRYSKESSNKYSHLLDGGFRRQNNSAAQESQDFGAIVADKYMKDKNSVQNLISKISYEKQLLRESRVGNQKCLICDNLFVSTELNKSLLDKNVFKCFDCGLIFHKKCMERENNCCFCQLSNINPLQKTRATLFLGILKKGTKIHEFSFELSKSQLKPELSEFSQKQTHSIPTLELRSIRMKDKADPVSNFINLFPDACSLVVNGKMMREFEPLHKQSSLKYRRDECMKISANAHLGNNKIVITERISKKDMKSDERIETENHLVGVFIVENLQIPRSSDSSYEIFSRFLNVLGSTKSTFQQSSHLLKQSLFIKDKTSQAHVEEDQELVCDSVKVPLTCSLTLQKMKFPGRTIFCKHFSCFDIQNFFLLNAQAKLPKWQCPICKASAYKFQTDCVLNSILQELNKFAKQNRQSKNMKIKDNERVAQVELNRLFEIKLLNSQGCYLVSKGSNRIRSPRDSYLETQFVPFWIDRVYDLPIEGKNKRQAQQIRLTTSQNKQEMSLLLQKPASKLNLKSKQNLENTEMRDEKEEIEKEKETYVKNAQLKYGQSDKILKQNQHLDSQEPIKKLQLYDSSDNSMKNEEEKPINNIQNAKKDKCSNEKSRIEKQVSSVIFKQPLAISPIAQKPEVVEQSLQAQKKAIEQQNYFEKTKKVVEQGEKIEVSKLEEQEKQICKTITIHPQILPKKEISQKQIQRLQKFLQNGFTHQKSNSLKHDLKLAIKKRDSIAIKQMSKVKVKERSEKRDLTIPQDADIIELSD